MTYLKPVTNAQNRNSWIQDWYIPIWRGRIVNTTWTTRHNDSSKKKGNVKPEVIIIIIIISVLAFFGFLRSSEYTCTSQYWFDPSYTLLVRNIVIAPNRSICMWRIGTIQDCLCPVTCMHTYISSHPAPDGPLFVLTPHRFPTRSDMVGLPTYCLPDMHNINIHAFRISGPSAAASAGVPNSTIQILGRWTSDYISKISSPIWFICDWSVWIRLVDTITRVWDHESVASVSSFIYTCMWMYV